MFRFRLRLWRRPLIAWPLVALLAALTATSLASATGNARAEAARWGPPVRAWVVARPVAGGEALHAGDVVGRDLPPALLPAGAVRGDSPIPGRVALVDLVAGEVLVASRLGGAGARARLVPVGRVALTVPVGSGTAGAATGTTAGLIRGDVVDVLATLEGVDPLTGAPASSASSARVVSHAALVLDTGDGGVTIAIPEADAPEVAAAITRGAVTLALTAAPAPAE